MVRFGSICQSDARKLSGGVHILSSPFPFPSLVPVDLPGVGAYDFAIVFSCQIDCQACFACCSGSRDYKWMDGHWEKIVRMIKSCREDRKS